MNDKYYGKFLSEEQIANLKASDIRKFEEQEQNLTGVAVAYLLSTFMMFVLLAAMILWFNKFTIFLFVVAFPVFLLFCFSYFKLKSNFKKKLKEFGLRDK